jgi:hypothetical protein
MQLRIRNRKDWYAGLLFLAFGLATVWFSREYPVGTPQSMGPGFAPLVLGALLALLGSITSALSLAVEGPALAPFALKPLVWVLASVASFALLIGKAGLLATAVVLVCLAGLASSECRAKEVLVSAALLGLGCVGLFVYGLHLPFTVWPW